MTIYTTDADKRSDKQNIFYNEYRTEDGKIVKYRCHRHKNSIGDEGTWIASEEMVDSWAFDDPALPEIIRKHIAG